MHKCFHKPILVLIEHGLSNGQALNTATGAKKHKQNTERSCCWIMISIKEGATRQKLESLKDFFLSIRFKGKERHLPRALFPISTTIKRREKTNKVCAKFHSRVTGLNLTTPVQYIQGVRVNNFWKINYIFLALKKEQPEGVDWEWHWKNTLWIPLFHLYTILIMNEQLQVTNKSGTTCPMRNSVAYSLF